MLSLSIYNLYGFPLSLILESKSTFDDIDDKSCFSRDFLKFVLIREIPCLTGSIPERNIFDEPTDDLINVSSI